MSELEEKSTGDKLEIISRFLDAQNQEIKHKEKEFELHEKELQFNDRKDERNYSYALPELESLAKDCINQREYDIRKANRLWLFGSILLLVILTFVGLCLGSIKMNWQKQCC